jgi:hypothetical protein
MVKVNFPNWTYWTSTNESHNWSVNTNDIAFGIIKEPLGKTHIILVHSRCVTAVMIQWCFVAPSVHVAASQDWTPTTTLSKIYQHKLLHSPSFGLHRVLALSATCHCQGWTLQRIPHGNALTLGPQGMLPNSKALRVVRTHTNTLVRKISQVQTCHDKSKRQEIWKPLAKCWNEH